LAVVLLVVLSFAGSAISFHNTCVDFEASIRAQYKEDQNNYDSFWKKITEMASISSNYAKDLATVFEKAERARNGQDGSKAVVSFIKEQNPNLSPDLYRQIMQEIAAGRESFAADQKTLLDKKKEYEKTYLRFPGSLYAGAMGFPHADMATMDIVTSDETDSAFKTKKAGALNLAH
jgi:hypothetical protein